MSFVLAAPEALLAAASDVAGIGSSLSAANAAVSVPTTGVLAAAADDVSTQVAALLAAHGQGYQQLSAQLASFHDKFVQTLSAGANTYAAAEANTVKTLTNAVNTSAQELLGHPLSRSGAIAGEGIVSSALTLQPTGGTSGLAGISALLRPAASAAAAAPAASGAIGTAIENLYLAVEPWVQYGFNLAAYAVGWLPYVGILAPQINFFYYLFEPIVQSVLFNAIDFIDGTVTFSQGLNNIWSATTGSINQFINTEIAWVRSFFPPLPPLP